MRDTDRTRSGILHAAAIGLVALAVRLPHFGSSPPDFDELYHMLAARSWLAEGTFRIGDGTYDRAAAFTVLAAESMRLFGQTFAAARLPALLAGILGVVAVFAWTWKRAGTVAAWVAGLLFALDPGAIHLSQWVRFYTVHGLCVWIGLTTVYALVEDRPRPPKRTARGVLVVSAVAWALALHLQVTTVVPLTAALLWAGWRAGLPTYRALPPAARTRWIAGLGVALAVLAVAVALRSDLLAALWDMYSEGPLWGKLRAEEPRYYLRWFGTRYIVLWALFPIAALLALARARSLAGFALTIFGFSLLVQSLGAAKSERYLYYALPLFFVVWGIAVAGAAEGLREVTDRLLERLRPLRPRPRARAVLTSVGLAAVFLFAYRYNDACPMTVQLVLAPDAERPYSQADWAAAAPVLRQLRDSSDVVVSSALVKALYFLGDGQVGLSRTEILDYDERERQFSFDPRTGRPMISEAGALEQVMACYRRGLLIIEKDHWRRADVVPGAVADWVTAHAWEVPIAPAWRIKAFRWNHSVPTASACPPWRASS